MFFSLFRWWRRARFARNIQRQSPAERLRRRPQLQILEDRCVPSSVLAGNIGGNFAEADLHNPQGSIVQSANLPTTYVKPPALQQAASLSGYVLETGTSTAIAGITVYLENSAGKILSSAVTCSAGAYSFTGLQPGIYQIAVDATSPSVVTGDTIGTVNGRSDGVGSSTFTIGSIILASGNQGVSYIFYVLQQQQPASLSGYVLNQSTGTGIAGITIELEDSSGDVLSTTVTASDGSFSFTGLQAGIYQLVALATRNWAGVAETVGTVNGTPDGTDLGNLTLGNIILASGNAGANYDFQMAAGG